MIIEVNMKRKMLFLATFVFLFIFLTYKNFWSLKNSTSNSTSKYVVNNSNNSLAIMIMGDDGKYTQSEGIPKSGYILSLNNSKCVNQNDEVVDAKMKFVNGKVIVYTETTLYCYLYFDKNNVSDLLIQSTNLVSTSQTVTLKASDVDGIDSYYFGKIDPSSDNVSYTKVSNNEVNTTETVSEEGKYYFSVIDAYGEITTVNEEFFRTSFSVTNGVVTPSYVITMKGYSFLLPTPSANTGYTIETTWNGNGKTYASGSSYTPSSNTTLSVSGVISGYTVKLNIVNGTTTSTNPVLVQSGKSAQFTINPINGYKLKITSDGCGGTLSGSTYTISNITSDKTCSITLKKKNPAGEYIKNYGPTGLEGTARNGLYRFLKTSNNYVCLGTCTTNTKYRIIGITDGSTTNTKLGLKSYQLKVIRNSVFANAVEWHNVKGADITWDQSTLFTYLNVTNKSKIIPSGWSNLISYVKWYNGVITSTAGNHETGALVSKSEMSSITSGTSQIGLMYRSDIFYSHIANGTYDCLEHPYCKDSWIPASSNNEWTMSRYRYDGSNSAGMIYSTEEYGRDGAYSYDFKFSVRPVFYLSTDVDYSGVGNGTSSNPFILE